MGSKPYARLFDIPSLPESLLKQKFLTTPNDTYDPNTVENFMKETLRYTGPEKPLFEYELPRTDNPQRDLYLKLHAEGTPYSHDPYHPELYLGDHTKDPRGAENNPNVSKITDQDRFRQSRYIAGKLQDDPDHRVEGTAPEKAVRRAVYDGFYNAASKMATIFDDSVDGSNRRANPNPGKTIQRLGDNIKEDQKFYESSSEKIIPTMGYNPVSLLSNQIGVNWEVQPEAKFGVSSISNLYRAKGAVDASINAVFRMGVQDEKFSESAQAMVSSIMVQMKDTVKKAKRNAMNAEIVLPADSKKNKFINRLARPTGLPGGGAAKDVQRMQKQKFEMKHSQTFLKPHNGNKQLEQVGIMEPRKNIDQVYGSHSSISIPKKDKMKIMRSIKRDGKLNLSRSEGLTQRYATNTKALTKAFTKRVEQYREKNGKNSVILPEEAKYYHQAPVHKPDNKVNNTKTTKSKFYNAPERITNNPTGQKVQNVTVNVGNYEFDTDPTTDNAYMTRRNGIQKMGYVFNEHVFDNDISPLSDVVNTRRYIGKPTLKTEDE